MVYLINPRWNSIVNFKSLIFIGFYMKISDLDYTADSVIFYVSGGFDESQQTKILHAHEDPKVHEIAKKYGLEFDTYLGLSLNHAEMERSVYGIALHDSSILVNNDFRDIAEETTQTVLGVSLGQAFLEYQEEHPDWIIRAQRRKSLKKLFE